MISFYYLVYGKIFTFQKLWNFIFPEKEYNEKSRNWILNYIDYNSDVGPLPDRLVKFNKSLDSIDEEMRNLFFGEIFAVQIPHDQFENNDGEEDYLAFGICPERKDNSLFFNLKDFSNKDEKYNKLLEKFVNKSEILKELQNPELFFIQNDCSCCT